MKRQFYGVKVIFTICILICLPKSIEAQTSINGEWHGAFSVMGQSFLMDLQVDASKNEVFMINPDVEGKPRIPCSEVKLVNNELSFSWLTGGLTFKGTYFPFGDSLSGTMSQSGLSWDMRFKRTSQEKKQVLRPQEPKQPFAYKTEDVVFTNPADKVQIFGTLTFPVNATGDFPIVVMASGSGPQDRDCAILGHKPFLFLADQFAKAGIATLRFDDRGTGKSVAEYQKASLTDFAGDVAAAVGYLTKRKDLKGHSIGLMGHSEGGMHILLAQQKQAKKVEFMVFLASIGGTGRETLVQQQYEIPLKSGLNDTISNWNRQLFDGIAERILKEPNAEKCSFNLTVFLRKMYQEAPAGAIAEGTSEQSFIANNATFMNNDWGRQFLAFDAASYLKMLSIPTFVLFGGSDIQVNPVLNKQAFERAFAENTQKAVEIVVVPGLNHLLQTCQACTVTEYGDLSETMSPEVPRLIISFIEKQ